MNGPHSITALYEPAWGDPDDAEDTELLIYFTYEPPQRERGPSYDSGGEPACPASVELHHVEIQIDGRWTRTDRYDDWAQDWLDGHGFDKAVDVAEEWV